MKNHLKEMSWDAQKPDISRAFRRLATTEEEEEASLLVPAIPGIRELPLG